MQYLAEPSKIVYRAKDGTEEKVFDASVSSTGREESVCPDQPQNRMKSLARLLKAPPLHLYPENPSNPR
jgi:hypothetical protein